MVDHSKGDRINQDPKDVRRSMAAAYVYADPAHNDMRAASAVVSNSETNQVASGALEDGSSNPRR
jgi:hypothetical protein